jgi:uncharacterized membrane protein
MELLRDLLLPIHVIAGFSALALFWVPALTQKGSARHRAAGRWYVRAMAFITVTGVVLALLFLAQGRWQSAVFLLFLGVITGTSLWNGSRVLRHKRDPGGYARAAHVAVALLNVGAGLGLIALGIAAKLPLLYAFGPVGLLIGGTMLAFALRSTQDPLYWRAEHLTGMIGSGIAAHVAFFAFGGRQLFGWGTGGYGLVLWIAPLVIGTVAIAVLNIQHRRRYRRTLAARGPVSASTAA